MDDLYAILGDTFDDLIVTEFLPGNEFTVDNTEIIKIQSLFPEFEMLYDQE